MEAQILFSEKQRFTQWWIWGIMMLINSIWIVAIFVQLIGGTPFGNNPMSDVGIIITAILTILLTFFMRSLRLETQIRTDGIYVKFFPFYLNFKKYFWYEISKCYLREYKPIKEYGGWGLRGFIKNRALNVSGNQGLQLIFTDNKKLLIGTNKPDEMKLALMNLGKLTE
ncbi:MAG: hypothetical protein KGZ71_07445 [Desulfobulbaceae bacterium]|nr:hypothetical protein [Candidatus Kapabacteria bacterium]MBS4000301.1 hypothetical protein [Desulfobulbaceae bacterium]